MAMNGTRRPARSLATPQRLAQTTNAENSATRNHMLASRSVLAPSAATSPAIPGYSTTCASSTTKTTAASATRSRVVEAGDTRFR